MHDDEKCTAKVTFATSPALLGEVQQHRRNLAERTGLRVSTSAAISALIRAGLAAQQATSH